MRVLFSFSLVLNHFQFMSFSNLHKSIMKQPLGLCLIVVILVGDALTQNSDSQSSDSDESSFENSVFRLRRNNHYGGRNPQDKGTRFGYQNPILVAPTLSSSQHSQPISTTTRYQQYQPSSARPNVDYPDSDLSESKPSGNYGIPTRKPFNPSKDRDHDSNKKCSQGTRLSRETQQCVRLGSSNGCSENMGFYAEPLNSEYGQCDCVQNYMRPLVYHKRTDKCYFIFQQAYCKKDEWLVVNPETNRPQCTTNTCVDWARNVYRQYKEDWDWNFNGKSLDNLGPVALLNERTCTFIGQACEQEGKGNLAGLLVKRTKDTGRQFPIKLRFDGLNLVCDRDFKTERREQFDTLTCRDGLFNKQRQSGQCSYQQDL